MSAVERARQRGGCGEVINIDAWCDPDAVPSTAGLCASPAEHREHPAWPQSPGTVDRRSETDETFRAVLDRIEAADEAEEGLRQRLAHELGRHGSNMSYTWDEDVVTLGCICGLERGTTTKDEFAANLTAWMHAHRLHVADAALSVMRGER